MEILNEFKNVYIYVYNPVVERLLAQGLEV